MRRTYTNGEESNTVDFFIGTEVEHTIAFGKKTLFVVGLQSADNIINEAIKNNCTHIYLGANMSFNPSYPKYNYNEVDNWDIVFRRLIDANFWITLDFEPKVTNWVTETSLVEYNRFIAMVSVRLPYVNQLGYHACLKIDDIDFDSTNDGVWVHNLHKLKDSDVFTHWDDYANDNPTLTQLINNNSKESNNV